MRKAAILYKDQEAAVLTQHDDGTFSFRYHDHWFVDSRKPPISLTLPKTTQEHHAPFLFPFFYALLPEGHNKELICNQMRIDHEDDFGLLMATATFDTIGAVRVVKIQAG